MEVNRSNTDDEIVDAIMECPAVFKIDGKAYYVYPMTLGKMFLLQRMTRNMEISKNHLNANASLEMLRVVREHKEECCDILAYFTARNDYYSVFDYDSRQERKSVFMEQSDSDIASFMMLILALDKTEMFMRHLGIDREQKNMRMVMKVKEEKDKNSYTFGGVSLFGYLLDVGMERYKMTKRQMVWEIDYSSLKILLADKVNTVYVTDEERRKIHIPRDRTKISGDDKEAVMKVINSQSWD